MSRSAVTSGHRACGPPLRPDVALALVGVALTLLPGVVGGAPGAAPPASHELLVDGEPPGLAASFNEAWRWVVFDTDSGLPSNSVYDLVETPAGTPWAATLRGVAWYDGFQWKAMRDGAGMPATRPLSITTFGDDEVIAVMGRGLYRGNQDGFEQIPVEVDGARYEVLAAQRPGNDETFVLAAHGPSSPVTLLRYDGAGFRPLTPPFTVNGEQRGLAIWGDGTGSLWANDHSALRRWAGGGWQTKLTVPAGQLLTVEQLVEARSGGGLVKVSSPADYDGLWEWAPGGNPERNVDEPPDLLDAMDVSPTGDAIVAYRSGNVRFREDGVWQELAAVPPQMTGLLFVKFRPDGDLWVGTQRGLYLFRVGLRRWRHWKVPSPDVRNEILEILRADDGAIWLATGRGIAVHRPGGEIDWIERAAGIELREVTGLAQDDAGGIWVSSGSALPGVLRWDGSRWQRFGVEEGLTAPLVHKIRKDRAGRLWFLGMAPLVRETTVAEPGAFVLEDEQFVPWTPAEGLINGRVYDFAEGSDGSRWFATFGGLSRWRAGRWTHWTVENGLHKNRIFTVAIDRDDRAWFGDQSSGLGYIDADDAPRYLTVADGLVHDEVQEIRVGAAGELWIATRGGLSCLHDGTWVSFDAASGLSSPILWPILPLEDRVLIGTSGNGVDVLSMAETTLPPPRVVLEAALIDQSAALLRWSAYAYWGQTTPERAQTRYRVDGEPWSDWSRQRDTLLTALSGGEHTFEVQAKGILGAIGEEPVTTTFRVMPPLFLRPLFLLPTGVLLLVVAVLLAGRRRYSVTLRQRDVEYRRRLEERVDERTEALRESEERLRLLLETAHVIPWVADAASWDFTYVGPQAVEILGYPIERWYERGFWEAHIHPDDVEQALSFCARQSRVADRYDFEYRMLAADGRIVWLHDLVAVVREDGAAVALRGFMIDVTARKTAEAERIEAESEALEHRERLAHLSRLNMLGEMATGIAHEVNQPLTAVSTYTQACRRMIEGGLIDEADIVDVLGRISDEAVRAGDMIHGLKTLVRKRRSEMHVCSVNELVRAVIPLAEVEARDRGIELILRLDEQLPEIAADDVQIQQVVLNMLRNAIEAAQPAGGWVKIRTRTAEENMIEVVVTDNGCGIAQGDPDRVFQPFYSTKQDGMGMGLSISRSIIEAHGGQIGYRPASSGGSTFYFHLPAERGRHHAAS